MIFHWKLSRTEAISSVCIPSKRVSGIRFSMDVKAIDPFQQKR